MHSPSIPSAQRAKFDPAVAKTPRVRHLAVWGLEMNRRELDGTECHRPGVCQLRIESPFGSLMKSCPSV